MTSRISFGRYHAGRSPIHALDPRVKLVSAVVFMISCLFVRNAASLALAAAALAIAARLSRTPVRRLLAQVRPVVLFLVATSLINLLFVHTGIPLVALGALRIYTDGLAAALLYTARFTLLLLAGGLLMLTTTPTALTDAAERLLAPLERIGVPVSSVALVTSIALRFVPTIAQEADNVIAAQTARGADLEGKSALAYARACVPLVVPLLASALRHADNLSRAMDARCYTGGAGRTRYHAMRFDPRRDLVFCLALAAYLVALAALSLAAL